VLFGVLRDAFCTQRRNDTRSRRDLAYQAALTATLTAARPRYRDVAPADWPDTVTEITHAPVTIRSYGPATAGKELMTLAATPR